MENKKIKNNIIKNEDLYKFNGGIKPYNKTVKKNANYVESKATYEHILSAIDKLDSSGKLDYLKN